MAEPGTFARLSKKDQDELGAAGLASVLTGIVDPAEAERTANALGIGDTNPFHEGEITNAVKNISSTQLFAESKASIDRQERMLQKLASIPNVTSGAGIQNLLGFLAGDPAGATQQKSTGDDAKDVQRKLLDAAAKIQGQRKQLLAELLDVAKATAKRKKGGVTPTAAANITATLENRVQKLIDKEDQSFSATSLQLAQIDGALASGQLFQMTAVLGQLARQVSGEKGVLTNKDIGRILPFTGVQLAANIKAFISGDIGADVSKVSTQLRQLILMSEPLMQARSMKRLKDSKAVFMKEKTVRNFAPLSVPLMFDTTIDARKRDILERMDQFDPGNPAVIKLRKLIGIKSERDKQRDAINARIKKLTGGKK